MKAQGGYTLACNTKISSKKLEKISKEGKE